MNPASALLASLLIAVACAQCPTNYVPIGSGCYLFLSDVSATYLEAGNICENFGGVRAQIKTCDELGLIAAFIEDNDADVEEGYWLGANDIINEGSFMWDDGSPVPMGAPFWGRTADETTEPQNISTENCVAMATRDGYYFHNSFCDSTFGYAPLCERPLVQDSCPSPYVTIGGRCFQFLSTLDETWGDARIICQSSGGDLAVVNDCTLFGQIIAYIGNNEIEEPAIGYWIGGERTSDFTWFWVDGEDMPMGVPFWGRDGAGPLQPDDTDGTQDCLELWARDRYYFNDQVCSAQRSPLCEPMM